jgi:hypothetical protein
MTLRSVRCRDTREVSCGVRVDVGTVDARQRGCRRFENRQFDKGEAPAPHTGDLGRWPRTRMDRCQRDKGGDS